MVDADDVLHVRVKAPGKMRCFWPRARITAGFWTRLKTGVIDPQTGLTVFEVAIAETPREIHDAARFTFTLVSGDRGIESNLTLDAATLRRLAE